MKNYTCLPGLELSSVPFPIFPDVSAVAWNLAFYFQNQWVTLPDGEGGGGGTSAATDIWATGVILVNKELIRHYCHFFYGPSLFYYVANHAGNQLPYTDVTQSNNLYYPAPPGWDFATDLGTPNLGSRHFSLPKSPLSLVG